MPLDEGGNDTPDGVGVPDTLAGAVERDAEEVSHGGLVQHRGNTDDAELQVVGQRGEVELDEHRLGAYRVLDEMCENDE